MPGNGTVTVPQWQAAAEAAIDECVRERRTVTYAGLAEAAGIPPPHRINKLTGWLESLMENDHALGRPLRAAVVVSRTDGLPRPGFFGKLEELGRADSGDRRSLHGCLLNELWGGSG